MRAQHTVLAPYRKRSRDRNSPRTVISALGGKEERTLAGVAFDTVSKRFGHVDAVRELTLEINDGEFFVLLGPSGCGKTTALRMVAGLEEPSAGRISIGGRIVNEIPAKDRDLAMVFQNYALYPHMSVYNNLAFGLRMRKYTKGEIDKLVRDVAQALGIEQLLARKPGELSGGQQQRVALGRAIVRRPQAFLMDEPLSNLDAKMRVQTRAELIRLHRELGGTFIYVTHDQVEAMTMSQRVAVMADGALQQVGPPQEVYDRPANLFVAEFIGSPAMNFLTAEAKQRDGTLGLQTDVAFVTLAPSQAAAIQVEGITSVVVGIRPEHVVLRDTHEGPFAVSFESTVDVVESLGSEQHVLVTLPSGSLTLRLPAGLRLQQGQSMGLGVSAEHLHLFDAQSKKRIDA